MDVLVATFVSNRLIVGIINYLFADIPDLMLAKSKPAKPFERRLFIGDQNVMQPEQI